MLQCKQTYMGVRGTSLTDNVNMEIINNYAIKFSKIQEEIKYACNHKHAKNSQFLPYERKKKIKKKDC